MSTKNTEIKISVGDGIKYDEVIIQFHNFGYERVDKVFAWGQFSTVGDTIKIFSSVETNPVAIEFWGNQVESIYTYTLIDNKKNKKISSIEIPDNNLYFEKKIISPGGLIVHEDHGIGIYKGKILKSINNKNKQFFKIEYANNDSLFVPENMVAKITIYQGIGRRHPRLSRLGSPVWKKTKKKIEESILLLARELLQVYAKRKLIKKNQKIIIDKKWDKKLADTFEHIETPDQETAIAEIYSDLQSENPMDRLLVGDVGFGKTEVAIRAATQVINNGMQVIILAPTTILSRQHYKTISKRLVDFPIKVAELSRFIPADQQKQVLEGVSAGSIDFLIGTHKILSSKLKYKNLGLLIIDEEQKFGVKDKDDIKSIKSDVDVLSMSATPIPRTLFISLSGIRQISTIKTPPKNRKPIITKVEKYDEGKIKEYIQSEINRGGQVYFLHNDVKTIQSRTEKIRKIFPDINVAYAHGQMSENALASTMAGFAAGEIDVLVCSTIIENGLDIPSVNTLIVENTDHFGLSQLYQLRGRIGRGIHQANAYFTYKNKLEGNAFKRLESLAEKTELGSGFDIAFSDLEIRGGGNILGREQHGNMEELGLILYTKLLSQAVSKLKAQKLI